MIKWRQIPKLTYLSTLPLRWMEFFWHVCLTVKNLNLYLSPFISKNRSGSGPGPEHFPDNFAVSFARYCNWILITIIYVSIGPRPTWITSVRTSPACGWRSCHRGYASWFTYGRASHHVSSKTGTSIKYKRKWEYKYFTYCRIHETKKVYLQTFLN